MVANPQQNTAIVPYNTNTQLVPTQQQETVQNNNVVPMLSGRVDQNVPLLTDNLIQQIAPNTYEKQKGNSNNNFVNAIPEGWGDNRLNLTDKNSNLKGYIEYSNRNNDSVTIDYVHNLTGKDRTGIGTKLVDKVIKENPNKIILWNAVEDEKAQNFKQSYINKHPKLANKIMTEGDYKELVALANSQGYNNVVDYAAYLEKENEKRNRRSKRVSNNVLEQGNDNISSITGNEGNKAQFNNDTAGQSNNRKNRTSKSKTQTTNETIQQVAPKTAKKQGLVAENVVNSSDEIKEQISKLETKKKRAGKGTVLYEKYQKQIDELRSKETQQNYIADVSNMVKTAEKVEEEQILKTKKGTYYNKAKEKREIEYVDEPPKGWVEDELAMTAPKGYTWYFNGKSFVSGKRKQILVKGTPFSDELKEIQKTEKYKNLPDKVQQTVDFVFEKDPIYKVTGQEFPNNGENLNERVYQYYKDNFDNKISSYEIGEIKLDKRSIKDSIYHGTNENKMNAFVAVPYVIREGRMIDVTKENNNGENRYLFIAPISLKGEKYFCEVVVKSNKDRQGFYIHEVELTKKLADVFSTAQHGTSTSSKSIIANLINNLNPNVKNSEQVIYDSPIGLTLDEWLSKPRKFKMSEKEMTLEEWRTKNGYPTILDEGLDWVRNPKGDTKTDLSFKKAKLEERKKSFDESLEKYNQLKEKGQIPKISEEVYYRADGNDTETTIAKAKVFYKRETKASKKYNSEQTRETNKGVELYSEDNSPLNTNNEEKLIGHIFTKGKKDLKGTLTDVGISDLFENELNNLSPDFTIEKFTPNTPHNRGKIDVRKNRIFINEQITSKDDFIKVVAHEIQHGLDEAEKLRITKKLANFEKLTDNEKKLLDDINKTRRATINKNEFYKNHKEIIDKIDNIYQNSNTLDELDYNFRINKISKNDIKIYEQYSKLVKKYANSPREKACNKFAEKKLQEYFNKKGGNNGNNKNSTRNTRILGNDERNSYTAIHEPIHARTDTSTSGQRIQRTTKEEQTELDDSEYIFDDDGDISNNSDIKAHIPDDIDEILPKVKPPKDNIIDRVGGVISTRAGIINPKIKHALRRFEFDSGMNENKYAEDVKDFITKLDFMTPSDYAKYDLALKNGNKEVITALNSKYNLGEDYTKVRNVLANIRDEALNVGMNVGYIDEYFPRKVINASAILDEYSKDTFLKKMLREVDPNNVLSDEDKIEKINTF